MTYTKNMFIVKALLLLGMVLSFTSCSLHGHYTGNPKSQGAFAEYGIILNKDKSFEIRSWTDSYTVFTDSLGNRIWKDPHFRGYGTFTQRADSLELTFLNEDSITVEIIKSADQPIDNYKLTIINEIGIKDAPIVSLKNADKKTIKLAFPSKDEAYTIFQDSIDSEVVTIGFDMNRLKSQPVLIRLDRLSQGTNIVKFKTYNGYHPKGTKTMMYCKRAWSGIRYGPKRRWLAKKYKMNWLNAFY